MLLRKYVVYQWLELIHLSTQVELTWSLSQKEKEDLPNKTQRVRWRFFLARLQPTAEISFVKSFDQGFFPKRPPLMEQCHASVTWMSGTDLFVYESKHCTQENTPNLRELCWWSLIIWKVLSFFPRVKLHKIIIIMRVVKLEFCRG